MESSKPNPIKEFLEPPKAITPRDTSAPINTTFATGEVENPTPLTKYTGLNLRNMYFLKQYEELIEFYDELDPKDVQICEGYRKNRKDYQNFVTTVVSTALFTFGLLKFKKIDPFVFETYSTHFYKLMPLSIFFYQFFKLTYINSDNVADYNQMKWKRIMDTRNILHSESFKLTNMLKYNEYDI